MALMTSQPVAERITARPHGRLKPGTVKYTSIYIFLGIYALFTIIIFVWVGLMSVKTNTDVLRFPPWHLPSKWQWENFSKAWDSGLGTMFRTACSFPGSARCSASRSPASPPTPSRGSSSALAHPLLLFFLIGIMIPYMLTAIPLYMKIEDIRQQYDIDSRLILVVLYTVSGFSFNTYVMTGFYKTLPYEMEEAATLDGASPFRTFWQVMIPLVRPGIASLAILNFVSLWNEFFYALIFTHDAANYTVTLGLVVLDQQAVYPENGWCFLRV